MTQRYYIELCVWVEAEDEAEAQNLALHMAWSLDKENEEVSSATVNSVEPAEDADQ